MKISATPVEIHEAFLRPGEVVDVRWVPEVLEVRVEATDCAARVRFCDVEAYRVMDERDLLEYWSACAVPGGWVYEVTEGGWLATERSRGTLIAVTVPGVREFLVVGVNACVSVLSSSAPEVHWGVDFKGGADVL